MKMRLVPSENLDFPLHVMANGLHIWHPPTPLATPSLDFTSIQKLVRAVLGSSRVTLSQVERLDGRLHRLFLLRLHDGRVFVLKCPPSYGTRVLRHEQQSLETEAQVLDLITSNPVLPVPYSIRCEGDICSFSTPYLLRSYIPGTRLSDISPYLSAAERAQIDRSIGYYLRIVSSHKSDTFGLADRVFGNDGAPTWREAFFFLLESALRDAEDLLINLPYDNIRAHCAQHAHLLDVVCVPQLVSMTAGTPRTVLIDPSSHQVTGILGWRDVIFGDPMLSQAFADASPAFWDGFGTCPARSSDECIRNLL
jgi:hypothetical protein